MRLYLYLLSLFILVACGTGGREERRELRTFFQTKAYDQGLVYLSNSKFYQDPNEKLLMLMEKGMLYHAQGDYANSSQALNDANKLSGELFTVSASKKVEKTFLNDNYDIYYGEVYERSMLHYYLSLNAILNYQKNGSRDELFKARAEILAWDSFIASVKEDRLGKSIYKNDLLMKVYGAKIHEMIGTREDSQIALQLYKDSSDVLLKNYNSYPTFNLKYQEFKKDFDKLPKMNISEVKKTYISESDLQKSMQDYLAQNISRLTKSLKKSSATISKTAVTLILNKGIIAEKVAEKNFYGLDFLAKEPLVAFFVADVLGLLPTPNSYNPGGAYLGVIVASEAMKGIGVGFELPRIINNEKPKKQFITVFDKENKEILTKEIAVINPMGDIAEEAVYEASSWAYARIGFRLATKHATAIAASFATYKALGGGRGSENNFLAKNAAVVQYIGAARVIAESEKADTRYWSTLPNEIRLADLELPPGDYRLELSSSDGGARTAIGNITVPLQSLPYLFSININ